MANRVVFFDGLLVFLSVVLVFGVYYSLYFFDFYQGAVSADVAAFNFLVKVVAVFLLFYSVSSSVVFCSDWRRLALFLFSVGFSCFYVLKGVYYGFDDYLFLNFAVCSLLYFGFYGFDRARFILFLDFCVAFLVLQVVLDFSLYKLGFSLWENRAYVGGLGNPSSFGFVCNILVAYVLFLKRLSFFSLCSLAVLIFGVLNTASLMSLILLVLVFFVRAMFWGVRAFVGASLLGGMIILGASLFELNAHLRYKFDSLLGFLFYGGGESISVSIRSRLHSEFLDYIADDPVGVVFFGYHWVSYYGVDSQYLTYFASFGVLFSLMFFGFCFVLSAISLLSGEDLSRFLGLVILMFLFVFLSNRILDYYPLSLVFVLFLAVLSELQVRRRVCMK
ncbi:hypothetical protein [Halopseudomonas yangmingensis]|uniref:O-Antigen ligase n=1 Tax=Halopseudomonas yangmingensis TaxID=1720063 RepID=A0A1I4T1N9_9GAMM|nr:hypothetical protein [Halopseudomonas yangmingensis]SFM70527.1 hypothetical protein SAMN05216217_11267 [Halopseudomonas yangmingensis]